MDRPQFSQPPSRSGCSRRHAVSTASRPSRRSAPLVQRIVQHHGGAVTAYSDGIGKGSEIIARLRHRQRPCARKARRAFALSTLSRSTF